MSMGAAGENHANEKKAGGWGAKKDDQACPECGKQVCGASTKNKSRREGYASHTTTKCPALICHHWPGKNTDHVGFGKCSRHMGSTGTMVAAAARQEIRMTMRRYGVPVEIDPETALREEISRTVGHVRWLADKVAEVGDATPEDEAGELGMSVPRVIDIGPHADDDEENGDGKHDKAARAAAEADKTIQRMAASQPRGDEALVWGITERETQSGGPGGGFDRIKVESAMNTWLQVYMAERGHLAKITDIAMKAGIETRRLEWAEGMAGRLIEATEALAVALGHDPKAPDVQLKIAQSLEVVIGASSAA